MENLFLAALNNDTTVIREYLKFGDVNIVDNTHSSLLHYAARGNSLEVANVPMGAGISMVLCPSEGTMYLKTLQGGAPSLIVYSIAPYEAKVDSSQEPQPDYGAQIAELRAQVEALTKKQKGGSFNELI